MKKKEDSKDSLNQVQPTSNSFPGWLYLGNLSSFPHFGHLKPSTLPACHLRSSAVGCTGPIACVLVPQFEHIGLSIQRKNEAETNDS